MPRTVRNPSLGSRGPRKDPGGVRRLGGRLPRLPPDVAGEHRRHPAPGSRGGDHRPRRGAARAAADGRAVPSTSQMMKDVEAARRRAASPSSPSATWWCAWSSITPRSSSTSPAASASTLRCFHEEAIRTLWRGRRTTPRKDAPTRRPRSDRAMVPLERWAACHLPPT
jgi:hypothetical protein